MVEDQVKKLGYQVLSYSRHFLYAHAELRKALTRNEIRGKYKFVFLFFVLFFVFFFFFGFCFYPKQEFLSLL